MDVPHTLGYRIFSSHGVGIPLRHPVILLRGLGRSSGFWLDFTEHLSQSAKVITLDLYGTGQSPSKWGHGTIPAFARDVVRTIREMNLLPCHLVGISLGGMVALESARQIGEAQINPADLENNVATLSILASSARCTREERIGKKAAARLIYALRKKVPRNGEFADLLVSSATLKSRPELPELWDQIWKEEGFAKIAVVRQLLAAAVFDGSKQLASIARPTFFMVSKNDGLVNWRNTPRLWERVMQGTLCVIEGAGHDFPTEKPKETAAALLDFFRNQELSQPPFTPPR